MTFTDDLLKDIADKSFRQSDIALQYTAVIEQSYNNAGLMTGEIDVHAINAAIVRRWSTAGLQRVKKMAWKQVKIK